MSLADKNEKIEEKVVASYQKIEQNTVSAYKKIEQSAVEGFDKVSNQFVKKLFSKDGESIEATKARLKENAQKQGGQK
ncbi:MULTISPECIES: hypothetical protein [unclassified Enterococcus]|uniref:hypothetical protein n=1 Tax=unclassified Enterococcus TaxID=2608891 RepID=UPI00155173E0|nr:MULTISPECIES: hypothetical protein [unclassified Enterococcus]MBS7578192.1 hypothetical protein [Enterococcus sp. MMGLQ5-2]MBS7585432.1 hypothetical protein [Enterococcus sp. MMGLQ5-1]NPD13289.1 hypothetical protein [Enterococcus sp. MMGLQ5-1]NPD38023.1 hypothetical protein [Enterococcus sp. MMGLQ5-2]